ncbi:MAG: MarR family winged helix-turn-helix transcriptional regulator [Solirubrobacterales bacterium]
MAARDVDQLLPLFQRLIVNYRAIEQNVLREFGLDHLAPGDVRTLYQLRNNRTDRITSLAKKMNLTVGTLSPVIDRLVKKELVDRERIEEDRRVVEVHVTQRGQEVCRKLERIEQAMADRVFQRLDAEERKSLNEILTKLLADTDEAAGKK